MASAEDFEALNEDPTNRGMAAVIKKTYNDTRDSFFSWAWKGLVAAASSHFGKGVIAVAAVTVLGAAFVVGGSTAIGNPTFSGASGWQAAYHAGYEGLKLLAHPLGLGVMGAAGATTAYLGYKEEQNMLALAQAEAAAREQRMAAHKAQEQARAEAVARANEPETTVHRRREEDRRTATLAKVNNPEQGRQAAHG